MKKDIIPPYTLCDEQERSLSAEELQEIIKHLRDLGNYEREPCQPACGVCFELDCHYNFGYSLRKTIISSFSDWSGDIEYPIKNPNNKYYLWENPARRQYCLHLAKEFEKTLKQYQNYYN